METERIRFFEKIAADAFVGLEETVYDGWELRFTQGFTGRANSVQIREASTIEMPQKVAFCEKAYAKHDLPCMFKLTDADGDLISYLAQRGYRVTKPTDVMLLALDQTDAGCDAQEVSDGVYCSATPEDWFESYFAFENMQDETKQELTKKIHAKVAENAAVDQVYIRLMHEGNIAAVASLAIESGYSLLHNVVVSPKLRGIGLGKKLCQAAIRQSKASNASHIYLQVMRDNPIALNLYQKLGFEKQYTYYYVVQQK